MSLDRRAMQAALPGYEIGGELGRGAFGVVYAGVHRQLGRAVAIKQLPRALAADTAVQQRFLAEARTAAGLRHPNIVPVYDFVERDGLCLMVMAHLGGGSLADRIATGPLAADEACRVMAEVLDALEHAHANGVIHRDVKPENILFDTDGRAQLADFGIARMADESVRITSTGAVVGTPAYLAPEVAMGDDAGPAADVYAAAAVLYEALSGRLPHPPRSTVTATLVSIVNDPPVPLHTVAPAVPAPLASLVMQGLAKEPAERPAPAAAFATRLRSAITATPEPPPLPWPAPADPATHTPRRWLVGGAVLAVVAVLAAAVFVLTGRDDRDDVASAATSALADDTLPTSSPTASVTVATEPTTPTASASTASTASTVADATTAVPVDTAVLTIDDPTISFPVDDLVSATAAFEGGCDAQGISPDECRCIITGIVDQFGLPRFITVTNALAAKLKVKKEIVDLATECLASV
jgi:serine/threonine protein kinase